MVDDDDDSHGETKAALASMATLETIHQSLDPTSSENDVSFFDLSWELRDEIYHHLWTFDPVITLLHQGQKLEAKYDDQGSAANSGSLPTWLLLNKTVLKEGLEQLYRKGTISWAYNKRKTRRKIQKPLLALSAFRRLEVDIGELIIRLLSVMKNGTRLGALRVTSQSFVGLRSSMMATPELRALRLKFFVEGVKVFFSGCSVASVNLSPLLSLPSAVNRVEVVGTLKTGELGIFELSENASKLLKQEVNRIGGVLVGRHATQRFTEKKTMRGEDELKVWTFEFTKASD